MAEINYFEIIHNKLDALVEKIIQKENSDENFRITYAQILEKINTKMDIFSSSDDTEKLEMLVVDLKSILQEREEVVDSRFNVIKNKFEEINDMLANSLKTPEILAAFAKIENQIHYLANEQENQKSTFENIISKLERSLNLEDLEDDTKANFAVVKEQNTLVNENVNRQIEIIKSLNDALNENSKKTLTDLNTIIYALKEFSESVNDDAEEVKKYVNDKVNEIVTKIQDTNTFVNVVNSNLTTLVQVVGNIFEDEDFIELKSDVADILVKTALLTEAVKTYATKEDIAENSKKNKEELKEFGKEVQDSILGAIEKNNENRVHAKEELESLIKEQTTAVEGVVKKGCTDVQSHCDEVSNNVISALNMDTKDLKAHINALEEKLLKVLDFSALENIKDFSEKMFFQGTEVLKEEIWNIKDIVKNVHDKVLTTQGFINEAADIKEKLQAVNKDLNSALSEKALLIQNAVEEQSNTTNLKLDAVRNDLTDYISEESVAAADQINELSSKLDVAKAELTAHVSEETNNAANKINAVSEVIDGLKKDIADVVLNKQNEQITEALQALQTRFVTQIVQIADNISFSDEVEELNDNMLACTDEVKEKINSDVSSIQDMLAKIDNTVSIDVNKDLQTLISGFKILTSGLSENKDYIYTLPDIESDLTKISLEINNIKKSLLGGEIQDDSEEAEKNQDVTTRLNNIKEALERLENSPLHGELTEVKRLFRSLSEDVSSISKRTNKLILTSDEVNRTLRNNINAFTSLLSNFEKQNKEFYNSAFLTELHVKVDKVTHIANTIMKSDQVVNEAFMYLAEWIDSTTDSFNEIKDDVSKMKKKVLSPEEESAAEKLAQNVIELGLRVDDQAQKIDAVEEKLNVLLSKQEETNSMMSQILAQLSIANEKIAENDKLAQDLASIDNQVKKIEQNISVITEYLDEEDEYEE